MKRPPSWPLLFAVTVAVSCLSPARSVRYYRSLAYNMYPLWEINPVYPVETGEERDAPYYYKVTTDARGRIVEIAFFKNHKQYNGVSQHYGNIGAPVVRISYSGREETRQYFDAYGMARNGRWGCHKDIYSLDEAGRRVALQCEDTLGVRISNNSGIYRYEWTWGPGMTVTEHRFDILGTARATDPDWKFGVVRYVLNDALQYVRIENLGDEGFKVEDNFEGVAQIRYVYNAEGQELGADFLDRSGRKTVTGMISGIGRIAGTRGEFDGQGRYIGEEYFDLQGRPTVFSPNGYAKKRMEYGLFDNRIRTTYLNESGEPVDPFGEGWVLEREKPDEDGYPLTKQYLNADSAVVKELAYEYDSRKALVRKVTRTNR